MRLGFFCLAVLAAGLVIAEVPEASRKWEKDIAAFEAQDRTHVPQKGGVLFVGSSSIRMWTNLAEAFPEWSVVRRGFGGAYLRDVNAYFDRLVTPYAPTKIVLYAGENDINGGRSPEEVFNDFKNFAVRVRETLPNTKIYWLSMKYSGSRWYLSPQMEEGNRLVRQYARLRPAVTYVDVATPLLNEEGRPDDSLFLKDRLHLNGKGYEIWAEIIRRVLKGS